MATVKKASSASTSKPGKARGKEEKAWYHPLQVQRSDGVVYTTEQIIGAKKNATEIGDAMAAEDEYMVRWGLSMGKHVKLNLNLPQADEYIVIIPENYHLRLDNYKGKKGAPGERKDVMLYGHPAGCSSRFLYRSPADFLPHLYWLMSGSDDRDECTCSPCQIWRRIIEEAEGVSRPQAAPGQDGAGGPSAPPGTGGTQQPPTLNKPQQPPGPGAGPSKPSGSHAKGSGSSSRAVWADAAAMFRKGEMVWFREHAWRIGIITVAMTEQNPTGPDTIKYLLAPLSHAYFSSAIVAKKAEDMRPFLTFSVPASTIDELANKAFGDVDWNTVIRQYAETNEQSLGVLALEASKIAANTIDHSYSTFTPIQAPTAGAVSKQSYEGVFLGAEQIRLGDAIRIKTAGGTEDRITVEVREIYEIASTQGPALFFAGNSYRIKSISAGDAAQYPAESQPQGPAFQEEIQYRNATQEKAGIRSVWELLVQGVVCKEEDVAGRLFVTPQLMEIVSPDMFAAETAKGVVVDAPAFLNSRMHNAAVAYIGKRPSRRATIGDAVNAQDSASLAVLGDGMIEAN